MCVWCVVCGRGEEAALGKDIIVLSQPYKICRGEVSVGGGACVRGCGGEGLRETRGMCLGGGEEESGGGHG